MITKYNLFTVNKLIFKTPKSILYENTWLSYALQGRR